MEKGKDVFIAPNATVLGNVKLADKVSVWFGAVIRGDGDRIEIGEGTNIQDLSVVHVDPGVPVTIGKGVTVGHSAIIHGCHIDDNTLIGMRATVMNGAKIGKNCIIGAHALVTEGKVIPDNSLVIGSPGKVVKQLDEQAIKKIRENATHYVQNGQDFLKGKYD